MATAEEIKLQPRWRFNYRFDAGSGMVCNNSFPPGDPTLSGVYLNSKFQMLHPRQIDSCLSPTTETGGYPGGPYVTLPNRQHYSPDFHEKTVFSAGTKEVDTVKPRVERENPVEDRQAQDESRQYSFDNTLGLRKTAETQRTDTSLKCSIPDTPESTSNVKNSDTVQSNNEDPSYERHVILPGGMFAKSSDVYVESRPNGTGRHPGGCLVMCLSSMLKRYDALEQCYFHLRDQNAQLRSVIVSMQQALSTSEQKLFVETPESPASQDSQLISINAPQPNQTEKSPVSPMNQGIPVSPLQQVKNGSRLSAYGKKSSLIPTPHQKQNRLSNTSAFNASPSLFRSDALKQNPNIPSSSKTDTRKKSYLRN